MYVKPHNNGQQISFMFISLSAGSMRVFCDHQKYDKKRQLDGNFEE